MSKILLIGNGGHCESIIDSLLELEEYSEIGLVAKSKDTISNNRIKCVGTDDDLEYLFNSGWSNAFVSVGSVGNTIIRRRLYETIKKIGYIVPNIIDKSAILSNNIKIGEGIYIGKGSIINTGVIIGNNSIINTGCVIEHNCIISDFCHISSNSTLCGNVKINNDTHVGAGSVIKQGIVVGKNSLIGIGSVVTKDIGSNVKAYGNPCREVCSI